MLTVPSTVLIILSAFIGAFCNIPLPVHADELEGVLMPGEVIQGHAKIEKECERCHKKFDKSAQTQLCIDCHKPIGKDISKKLGFHGKRQNLKECHTCHTDHKGRDFNIAPLDEKTFNHELTDFELNGGHKKTKCRSCHLPKVKYRYAPSGCYACHKKDDIHEGALGPQCTNCHNERTWEKQKFDHNKTTFPLLGKHSNVKCEECHSDRRYNKTPTSCYACHKKDDIHKNAFGRKCESCHVEKGWLRTTFDHNLDTNYVLEGKHKKVKCESCHKTPVATTKMKTTCYACHKGDDEHKGQFGRKCESCHTERNWENTTFDHVRDTTFPLRGKHKKTKCEKCHTGHLYKQKLKTDCYSCHKKEDEHKGQYGQRCDSCHVETNWKTLTFDHNRDTDYLLKGKHKKLKCQTCHKGHLYKEQLLTYCYACHKKDDKHKGQEGKKCETCHNERSWKKTTFDHGLARFPLLGKHQDVQCKECHKTQEFKNAPLDCLGCHEKDDYHHMRLGPKCESCHNSRDWKLWDFDHNRKTEFTLDGAHEGLKCESCHQEPMKEKVVLDSSCVSCHKNDDIHEGKFGHRCAECHVTSSFSEIIIKGKVFQ